jgi:hypothetical protein
LDSSAHQFDKQQNNTKMANAFVKNLIIFVFGVVVGAFFVVNPKQGVRYLTTHTTDTVVSRVEVRDTILKPYALVRAYRDTVEYTIERLVEIADSVREYALHRHNDTLSIQGNVQVRGILLSSDLSYRLNLPTQTIIRRETVQVVKDPKLTFHASAVFQTPGSFGAGMGGSVGRVTFGYSYFPTSRHHQAQIGYRLFSR